MDHLYIIVSLNGKELYFSTKTLIELKQKKSQDEMESNYLCLFKNPKPVI